MGRIRAVTSHVLMALAEASLIAILVVGLIAGTAFAAKGGNSGTTGHGHHSGGGGYTATVAVSPNPVPAYSEFQITGCGYAPSDAVQFDLYSPVGVGLWDGLTDTW